MRDVTYLVFGDLHGRVLPAFRLAAVWAREHATALDGILQVGDLGYFPDATRLDKATKRIAEKDPLELGVQLVAAPSKEADAVFDDPDAPPCLWFTAGNHEDYDALAEWEHGVGPRADAFVVDAYCRVRCIRDGHVADLAGGLRVGSLWGIDDKAPRARQHTVQRGRIRPRSANELAASSFDVLLCHESPRDAIIPDAGSEEIDAILNLARPAFAFFGHYGGAGHHVPTRFEATQVYHLAGFELRGAGGCAEDGSVGLLRWENGRGEFAYLPDDWLHTFTRHNWRQR
jgi:hypothetical protein